MQRIGIIGVGEIGKAIVEGLCEGVDNPPRVCLSPRSARTVEALSSRYEGTQVCGDNQSVVDRSDLVVIAVRPVDRHEALTGLRVGDEKTVVNLMSGVHSTELRQILATGATLVRAIPLPSVRERRSVTVTFPSHSAADALFDRLGRAQPVATEEAFNVYSALTGTLTTHYSYLAALTSWAVAQGVSAEDADRYVRGLFQGVGRALGDETRSLHRLAADHETPNGNNERIRTTWFDQANTSALGQALDRLLTHLNQSTPLT